MKNIAIAILTSVLTVLFCGCHESSNKHVTNRQQESACPQDSVSEEVNSSLKYIVKDSVATDIAGVDSLIVFSLYHNDEKKLLFNVANGGNIEYLSDSILNLDNQTTVMFAFADYSQIGQIFYILFNCDENTFTQSRRINLPSLGMTINDVKSLTINCISGDSICVGGPDVDFSTEIISLDCDSNRIINYYEYQ